MPSIVTLLEIIFLLLFPLALIVLLAITWRNIFSKAGYPAWYWVLMLIPLINFVMLLYLAFSKWPVLKEKDSIQNSKD